jgi:DNA-binding transcriptional MerR regulator
MTMDERRWTVGELARATALTVRTLHHFDEIGLLRPSERSEAGHRRYTSDDVRRLYRILALRHLGMPLGEIASALDGGVDDLELAVRRQLEQVERHLELQRQLRQRLGALLRAMQDASEPSIDALIQTMEAMMQDSFFTDEQLAAARARHQQPGFTEELARWQQQAAGLARELTGHLERGTNPSDPAVQELARRWSDLMTQMIDDKAFLAATYAKIDAAPEAATRGVLSAEVWDYLKRAFAVGFAAGG